MNLVSGIRNLKLSPLSSQFFSFHLKHLHSLSLYYTRNMSATSNTHSHLCVSQQEKTNSSFPQLKIPIGVLGHLSSLWTKPCGWEMMY